MVRYCASTEQSYAIRFLSIYLFDNKKEF